MTAQVIMARKEFGPARRPVRCTGGVVVVVTKLAASVKPAVPGGSLAGPRRPRRTR
jgi:hypothetical protein